MDFAERTRRVERALLRDVVSVQQHLHDTLCVALKGLDAPPLDRGPVLQNHLCPSSVSHNDMVAELRSKLTAHEDNSEIASDTSGDKNINSIDSKITFQSFYLFIIHQFYFTAQFNF